jgi:murein lipoprotein
MGKLLAIVPAAATLLALGGCATKGDVDQLRSDIAGLRSQVEATDARAAQAQAEAQQAAAAAAQANARPAAPPADQAYRRSLQK